MIYEIAQLKGINQDKEMLPDEFAACSNIIGEAIGFSCWKGRTKFVEHEIATHLTGIYSTVWPDQHESLMVVSGGEMWAIESGTVVGLSIGDQAQTQADLDIAKAEETTTATELEEIYALINPPIAGILEGLWDLVRNNENWLQDLLNRLPAYEAFFGLFGGISVSDANKYVSLINRWRVADAEVSRLEDVLEKIALSLSGDPRNPTYFTKHQQGNYVIGSNYLRDPAWSWDGNIDRNPEPIATHNMMYRMIESWGGRLWGIDGRDTKSNKVFPMLAFYGEIDEIEIKAGNWLEFRDNPQASRLIAMRSSSRDYAYVWGDKGLWQVQLTGSWPLFVQPQLIHAECDCVGALSIVEIPGIGFVWRGVDSYWILSGGLVRQINLSNDARRADRIKTAIHKCPLDDLHRMFGIHYPKRRCVIWSYPTVGCTESHPWEQPESVVWLYETDSWYILDQGWMGGAGITHTGRKIMVVTDTDGFIYELDRNITYDKDEFLEWYAELEWIGQGIQEQKWMWAILERPMSGTNAVAVEFWARHQSEALESEFTLDADYDDVSQLKLTYSDGVQVVGTVTFSVLDTTKFPDSGILNLPSENKTYTSKTDTTFTLSSGLGVELADGAEVKIKDYDPGGPNDQGVPPAPLSECQIPIRLMSKKLKVRLSNASGSDVFNGPEIPMISLKLVSM